MNQETTVSNTANIVSITDLLTTPIDFTTGPVALSPLVHPLRRLAEDLDSLVRDGHLQGVELNLKHLECPCFLLRIAPNKPQFYVELFRGDLDVAFEEDEEVPLCVLMNWLGSDTEPAYWETYWEADAGGEAASGEEPGFGEEPDFREVLGHILFMTEDNL